jgi:hypothetical protein
MQAQQNKPNELSSNASSSVQQQATSLVTVVKGKAIISASKADKSSQASQIRKPVIQSQTFDFVGIAG